MTNPLFGAKPVGKNNSTNSARAATSNPLFDPWPTGGTPVGIANPSYSGPVMQGGADMSQFPQYNNYTFHNGVGQGPLPNTDPVGAYSYGNTSVNDLLSQINSLYGATPPDFSGEAGKQAATIYAPVLADLDKQGALAKTRAGQNDAQLKAMYSALQNNIGQSGTAMQAQTAKDVAGIKALGAQGQKSVANNYGNAMDQASGIMQKLGIQDAAAANLPRTADNQALMQSLMQMNTQGAANLAQQTGQNAANFNTAQKNIAGFEGSENQYKNQQNLQTNLANFATEKAQVGSQQASQAAGFMQNLQNQYLNSVNQKASALTNMYSQQQQMAMMQNQNQMQLLQMQYSKSPSDYQRWQMTPTTDKLAAYAGQLFGSGGNTASQALQFIESMGGTQASSGLDFADKVARQAANDPNMSQLNPNQLRALAMQAYTQLKVNPNPMNYIGP